MPMQAKTVVLGYLGSDYSIERSPPFCCCTEMNKIQSLLHSSCMDLTQHGGGYSEQTHRIQENIKPQTSLREADGRWPTIVPVSFSWPPLGSLASFSSRNLFHNLHPRWGSSGTHYHQCGHVKFKQRQPMKGNYFVKLWTACALQYYAALSKNPLNPRNCT